VTTAAPQRYLVPFGPKQTPHLFTDVLVIGAGIAGLRAALAVPPELQVLDVTKDAIQQSNSTYAQGGIAGVLSPEDRFENHIEDTLAAGARDIWEQGAAAKPFTTDDRIRLRLRMTTASRLSVRVVDLVHDAAGMSGVRPGPLERSWRDAHTASQHILLAIGRLEVAGRLRLGLDPGSPVI